MIEELRQITALMPANNAANKSLPKNCKLKAGR